MARFTKEKRQEIISDFAALHNGLFNAATFVETVEKAGRDHPAYDWFTWDQERAASEYRVWQAREFARGLRVRYSVEEIRRDKIRVSVRAMPFVISPVESRREGGGYYVADHTRPEHMSEYCRQAAVALRTWLHRYGAAAAHAGGSRRAVERLISQLEQFDESKAA